jgi:hypothetical protein
MTTTTTTTTPAIRPRRTAGFIEKLNTRWHRAAMTLFAVVVVAHWAEHIAQAVQIYALGWPVPKAGGVLGLAFPWLVKSEWLHYGFAIVMLVAFVTLRRGMVGRARRWWDIAMWIQVWHHFEHLLLLVQALTGSFLLGAAKPMSILQLTVPRVELHLFYNTIVTVPMIIAMYHHLRPRPAEHAAMRCSCAVARRPVVAAPALQS